MGFLRRHKKLSAAVLVLAIFFVSFVVRFVVSFMPVPLVISKETTYITEPLRSDGTPDYVAALNQRLSKGVTPENNAAALFWKAAGRKPIQEEWYTRCFRMLGVPEPPEKGDYYVTSEDWIERLKLEEAPDQLPDGDDDPLDVLLKPIDRPWSEKEFPLSARWLAANEKPLALVVEGCKRPRRYDPFVLKDDNAAMIHAPMPVPLLFRDFARSLVLRAMLRVRQGRTDEAWSDLMACHRLARLVGPGLVVGDVCDAIIINQMAEKGDEALLGNANLTAVQIAKMRQELRRLPSMPRMVDVIDHGERLVVLDAMLALRREVTTVEGRAPKKMGTPSTLGVDWNLILRMANSWYDRAVAALRLPTRAARLIALRGIDRDLDEQVAWAKSWKAWASQGVTRRETMSRQVGLWVMPIFWPSPRGAEMAEGRATLESNMTDVAFALAEHRAERGHYPARLVELVPKYLKEAPKDIFNNDADLHYLRKGNGYLLYSVGDNGKDDGGKGRDDAKNGEGWDDLVVRMSGGKP